MDLLTPKQPNPKILLSNQLKKYKVTIAGVTETHLPGNVKEDIGKGRTLIWSDGSQRRGSFGLALISTARKVLLSFSPVTHTLPKANFDVDM